MEAVGVRQARADLARLVDQAGAGDPVVISRHGQDVAAVLPAAAVEVWQRHLAGEADRQRREAEAEHLGGRLPASRDPVCPRCRSSYLHVVYHGPVVAALVNTADPDAGVQAVVLDTDSAMLDGVAWVRCASCWEPLSDRPRHHGRPAHEAATTIADEKPWPPGDAWELVKTLLGSDGSRVAAIVLAHDLARGAVVRVTHAPAGIEQEMWALLTLYQILRTAMVAAVESVPGTNPDRASFTVALNAARDLVIQAAGVISDTVDLVGHIGREILANLLDDRRPRVSTRKVKCPVARYHARQDDGRPLTSQNVTQLTITVHDPDGNTPNIQ